MTAPEVWSELNRLEAFDRVHDRAQATFRRAGDDRARAAWRAKQAGASYGQIALSLGIARPNAVTLVRRGGELEGAIPPAGLGVVPSPEPAPVMEVGPVRCARIGCGEAAQVGRFCEPHSRY